MFSKILTGMIFTLTILMSFAYDRDMYNSDIFFALICLGLTLTGIGLYYIVTKQPKEGWNYERRK